MEPAEVGVIGVEAVPIASDLKPFPGGWTRALAVVAHPDDLEYGPASAIASWTAAGCDVGYCIVSSGEAGMDDREPAVAMAARQAEERRAAEIVGVRDVVFLGHPDGRIEGGLPLRRDIAREIRRFRPDIVITINFHERWRSGDWNCADHRAVGRAVMDAAVDAGSRWIFPELFDADALEPWRGVRFVAVGGSPAAGHAVDITDSLDRGIQSLAAHVSYLESLGPGHPMTDPTTVLERKADRFASRFGGRRAMTFEVIGV